MFSFRLKRFALFFVPLVLLTSSISFNFYLNSLEEDQQILSSQQEILISYQKQRIEKAMSAIISELMVLSSHHNLKAWLEEDDHKDLNVLADEFLAFSQYKGIYDQARLIGIHGDEIVRVNWNAGSPAIVPESKLQNKADRYYFKQTISLGEGEFFISAFDLNVENGAVEEPIKPVIRMGTPVFDADGHKRGIIVLNMIGSELLGELDRLASGYLGRTMLINADGYWLKSDQRADEWGFMFSDRRHVTMQNRFPEASKVIMRNERGSLSLNSGLFTFTRVIILPGLGGDRVKNDVMQKSWWLISYVSQDDLSEMTGPLLERYLLFNAVFLLLFAMGSWLGADAMQRHHLAEKQLMASEKRFRSVTETARDAIIIADSNGNIISWNSGAIFIFGYAESEMLGEPVSHIMPDRYRDMHTHGIKRHKHTAHPEVLDKTMELHGLRKDGVEIDIRFSLSIWASEGEHFFGAIIHDITETKKLERELESMASRDGLTGLYNRASFDHRVIEELSRAKRYKQPVSLLFLDIDYFKQVNDIYGHAAGDVCLIDFATLMLKMSRNVDVVARYGGEEFIIILPHTNADNAQIFAERLREAAERQNTEYKDQSIAWTVSIGLASLEHDWDVQVGAWIERADQALYRAKDGGRNRIEAYTEGDTSC